MSDYNQRMQQAARNRAERVIKMRAKGMTWKVICELEGDCSRQALHKLIARFGSQKL